MRPLQMPAEYRAQAAENARSLNHRKILLDTAQTWQRMADEAELIKKRLSDLYPPPRPDEESDQRRTPENRDGRSPVFSSFRSTR